MKRNALYLILLGLVSGTFVGCEPDNGEDDFESGKTAFAANDLKKAERNFESCLAKSATNVEAVVYLTRVKLGLGELTGARQWVSRAKELAGGDSDVRLLAAQIDWHAKDFASAAKGFSALANDSKLPLSVRSEGWSGLGIVEMTQNNRDLAQVAFLRAVRMDRHNASAWYHLGFLYRDGFGYAESALEQFSIFVRLSEVASPRVQKVQRTVIPELKDTIARAAASRPGAAKRDSGACAAALAKAEAAMKKGNLKSAKQAYQDALKADPLSHPAAVGLAKAWLKTDATKKGMTSALDAYKQACVASPGAVTTFVETADLANKLGLNAMAVEVYSRAVAANPTSIVALDGYIRSLRRTGKNAAAQAFQSYRDSLTPKKK